MRDVPDVSLAAASHDGYLVYSSDNTTSTRTRYVFGGTSASAPSFAGIMALINQKTGARQGNANPRFYQMSAMQASGGPASFHLITSGNNSVPGLTGFAASASTPYFNLATGLGSVDGNVLINNWSVTLANTATTLVASPLVPTLGQSVSLTATVTGSSPTGTVQFKDGTINLGSAVALSGAVAATSTTALGIGTHAITAMYSGDSANSSSVSAAQSVTVGKAPSSISLVSTSSTTVAGQMVTFTATLSGNLLSGTLQFMDGSTSLGVLPVSGCATALSTSALGVGIHNITVIYSGDANNLGSTSAAVTQTVSAALTTSSTTLSASASTSSVGQAVTFTASVSGNAPTGTVQFSDGTTDLGGPVTLGTTSASFTTSALAAGAHAISATYSGDAANSASVSAPLALTVSAVVPTDGSDVDTPTLPQWAAFLMGLLLLAALWRQSRARVH
jgi:hypothetical protein